MITALMQRKARCKSRIVIEWIPPLFAHSLDHQGYVHILRERRTWYGKWKGDTGMIYRWDVWAVIKDKVIARWEL